MYNNAKYAEGNEELHEGMILSAKNLVIGTSSFSIELMKFNDKLKKKFFFTNLLMRKIKINGILMKSIGDL